MVNIKLIYTAVLLMFVISCHTKNEQKHFLFDDTKVQKKTVKELYEYNLKELEKIMDSEHKKMNPKAIEPINFLTKISGHESSGDMTYWCF